VQPADEDQLSVINKINGWLNEFTSDYRKDLIKQLEIMAGELGEDLVNSINVYLKNPDTKPNVIEEKKSEFTREFLKSILNRTSAKHGKSSL